VKSTTDIGSFLDEKWGSGWFYYRGYVLLKLLITIPIQDGISVFEMTSLESINHNRKH